MTPTFAAKKGGSRYRFYACVNALKRGRQVCPSPWLPVQDIEKMVIEQIQEFCRNPSAAQETLAPFLDPSSWDSLPAAEQARLVREIIQRVEYDGREGRVAITFHPPDHPNTNGTPFLARKDNDS
jgi:hypothetical protein